MPWLRMRHLLTLTGVVARCAGDNVKGQLGDGSYDPGDGSYYNLYIPVAVQGSQTFTQASSGEYHTCGVRTDGAALCWGE